MRKHLNKPEIPYLPPSGTLSSTWDFLTIPLLFEDMFLDMLTQSLQISLHHVFRVFTPYILYVYRHINTILKALLRVCLKICQDICTQCGRHAHVYAVSEGVFIQSLKAC